MEIIITIIIALVINISITYLMIKDLIQTKITKELQEIKIELQKLKNNNKEE